jgi:hypothetical protein
MELWLAVVLFFVSAFGTITAGMRYRKSKKRKFIVLMVVAALLALALLAYSGLTLILVGGDRDAPVAVVTETAAPTPLMTPAAPVPTVTSPIVTPSSTETPSSTPFVPIITEIDHYTLHPDEAAHATYAQKAYYRQLVEAVYARETVVRLSDSYDENLYCWGLLMDNPIYFVVDSVDFSADHKTLLFTYAYSAEEQAEMLAFMDEEYLSILNEIIPQDANELEKVLRVYRYFSNRIEYNYEWLEDYQLSEDTFLYPDIQIYEALKTNKGVCHSYSYLCEYALAQLGIDCFGAVGHDTNADGDHMWILVKIDGNFYYCDPTWDRNADGTVGLRYFGMTTERRAETGLTNFDNFEAFHEDAYGPAPANDGRFSVLWDTASFEFGPEHTLILYDDGGQRNVYDTVKQEIIS